MEQASSAVTPASFCYKPVIVWWCWTISATAVQSPLSEVGELAGSEAAGRLHVIQGEISNRSQLDQAFASASSPVDAVIHFAGLKAVGESVQQPLRYWNVNVNGSRCLLEAMASRGCHTLVFSSSATLYGYPDAVPIPETSPIAPPTPTATPRLPWYRCCQTCNQLLLSNGGSLVYVISTLLAPIPLAASVRIPVAFPTTFSPS